MEKIAKYIGPFWRKFRRIAFFLILSNSKIKEISQNCVILEIIQFQKMKKSRRIGSFFILSISKNEEISPNSLVCKLADRQVDR